MPDRAGVVQHVNINVAASGTVPLVDGIAGMDVIYVNLLLIVNAAQVVTLEDTSGTDRVGPLSFAPNGGVSAPDSGVGWQRSAEGQGVNIRTSTNARVGGSFSYRYVPHWMRA